MLASLTSPTLFFLGGGGKKGSGLTRKNVSFYIYYFLKKCRAIIAIE